MGLDFFQGEDWGLEHVCRVLDQWGMGIEEVVKGLWGWGMESERVGYGDARPPFCTSQLWLSV